MKYKTFLYSKDKTILLVYAKNKPSRQTTPRSGTWVVRELHKDEWLMPRFPKIIWRTLSEFKFLGELKGEIKCKKILLRKTNPKEMR